MPMWYLVLNVCIAHACMHHSIHPGDGWSSREACLVPVDVLIERAEAKLDRDPRTADEEHYFHWDCVKDEDLRNRTFKLTNHRVLGGKWI